MAKIDEIRNKFKNLTTLKEIKEFLIDRAERHSYYYHYTSIDALKSMLQSKTLRLSHITKLNDLTEGFNHNNDLKNLYVGSFSFSSHESVALWSIYNSSLNKAIRIKFTKASILKTIKNTVCCHDPETRKEYVIKNIKLVDITYFNDKTNSIRWNRSLLTTNKCSNLKQICEDGDFTGAIKNIAWEYETEVRILVELDITSTNPPPKIDIDVMPLWKSAKILCGPCLPKEDFIKKMNSFYKNHPDAITLDFEKHNTVDNSFLLNKLVLKTKCEHCCKKEKCDTYKNKS